MNTVQPLFVAGLVARVLLAQTSALWTPEFSMGVQTVGAVIPSPDGARVVWTQTKARMDGEHSENVTQIWLARSDGTQRLQLTRAEKSSSNPAWSPDGEWIYFSSARFGKEDLFRIPANGGESETLTKLKGGVGVFSVSKDGKWLAYTSAEPDPDDEKAVKEKRDFRVLDEKPKNAIMYVLPAEADANGERKPRAVTAPDRHVQQIAWSPDGASIAFVYWHTPLVNEWRKARVAETNVATGAIREIGNGGGFAGAPKVLLRWPLHRVPAAKPHASQSGSRASRAVRPRDRNHPCPWTNARRGAENRRLDARKSYASRERGKTHRKRAVRSALGWAGEGNLLPRAGHPGIGCHERVRYGLRHTSREQ